MINRQFLRLQNDDIIRHGFDVQYGIDRQTHKRTDGQVLNRQTIINTQK